MKAYSGRAAEGGAVESVYMPCAWCGRSTLFEVLSQHGSRCRACFDAYCARPQARPHLDGHEHRGARAWAFRLRERHQGGERLTKAQIDAYQAAIDGRVQSQESAEEFAA